MDHVVIGIDVGNATTEAVMATIAENGTADYLCSALVSTSGTKGTTENIKGIREVIEKLTNGKDVCIDRILLNDAAPVIADFAMDTITETIITDSAMIGHNPDTPGGEGLGIGETIRFGSELKTGRPYLVIISKETGFEEAAEWINRQVDTGHIICGAIVQQDEGTLISNRLEKNIPIVDEVRLIDNVPVDMPGAIEVASPGRSIEVLSNPYGIATVFELDAEETMYCRNIAKALIGNRSAVVIKTPSADIQTRVIQAGEICVEGERYSRSVSIDSGAEEIMDAIDGNSSLVDIKGKPGTNIGGMLENIRDKMARSCDVTVDDIRLSDLFATDSYTAVPVHGGLASEFAMENGVAIAAMVHMNKSFMKKVGEELQRVMQVPVEIGGVEAVMALKGVLTTPGTAAPCIMIDMGAGSIDGATVNEKGQIDVIHLAGAGNLITKLIQSELNLTSFEEAELVKKYPLAKVDNLYRLRYENGDVVFFDDPLPPKYYGRTIAVKQIDEMFIIETGESIEKIRHIRRNAKKNVIGKNIRRIIEKLDIDRLLRQRIVLVGGSALDFELSDILTEEMDQLGIVAGKGNIRGCEGPRSAVATGLILDHYERSHGQ